MKKIISFIMIMCLLVSTLPLCVSASESVMPTKLFELDLSEASASNIVAKDKAANSTIAYGLGGKTDNKAAYGTINSKTGVTPYLTFSRINESGTYVAKDSQLMVTLADQNPMGYDALTVEFWAARDLSSNANNKFVFSLGAPDPNGVGANRADLAFAAQELGSTPSGKYDAMIIDPFKGNTVIDNKKDDGTAQTPSKSAATYYQSGKYITSSPGEWVHYVYTVYKVDGTTSGKKKYVLEQYTNGNLTASKTGSEQDVTNFANMTRESDSETNVPFNTLAVGGSGYGEAGSAFAGSIGTFILYAGQFTQEQAAARYEATVDDFSIPTADDDDTESAENVIFEMDLSDCTTSNVKAVKNKANVEGTTIQYGRATSDNQAPTLGELTLNDGTKKKYLSFASVNGTTSGNKNSQLVVTLPESNPMGHEGLTFECWIKSELPTNAPCVYSLGGAFGTASTARTAPALYVQEVTANGRRENQISLDEYSKETDKQLIKTSKDSDRLSISASNTEAGVKNEWMHFVMTISKSAGTGDDAGKSAWVVRQYYDGELVWSTMTSQLERTDYSKMVRTSGSSDYVPFNVLTIGGIGTGEGDAAYGGSIGSFIVYNEALDATAVREQYCATLDDFKNPSDEIVIDENGWVLKDASGEITTKDNASSVSVTGTVEDWGSNRTLPVAFIAVYDNDALVAVEECETEVNGSVLTVSGAVTLQDSGFENAKLFVWYDLNAIVPATEASCLR